MSEEKYGSPTFQFDHQDQPGTSLGIARPHIAIQRPNFEIEDAGLAEQIRKTLQKLTPRTGRLLLVSLVIVPVAFWLAFRGCVVLTTSRANTLLFEIQQLRPNESTFEDAMRVARQYPGSTTLSYSPCSKEDCDVLITVGLGWAWFVPFTHALGLERVGIRAMWMTASVDVLGGRVIGKSVELWTEASWGTPSGEWLIARTEITNYPGEKRTFYVTEPHISTAGGGRMLVAQVAANAPKYEIEKAFDFRLACTSTLKGCSELSDLLPAAWDQYLASRPHSRKDAR